MGEAELTCIPDALSIRTFKFRFLGLTVALPVRSWRDELFTRFAVMMKQKSIERGQLRVLSWEDAIGVYRPRDHGGVNEGLLTDFQSCREAAEAALQRLPTPNLKQICELLESKRDTLLALDRSFILELGWLKEAITQGAHAKLEMELGWIFLAPGRKRTAAEALESLNELEGKAIFSLCPVSSQALVTSCKKYVQMLLRGICPDGLEESDGFMAQIIERSAFSLSPSGVQPKLLCIAWFLVLLLLKYLFSNRGPCD